MIPASDITYVETGRIADVITGFIQRGIDAFPITTSTSLDCASYDTSLLRSYFTNEAIEDGDEIVRDALNEVLNLLPMTTIKTKTVFYKLVNSQIIILWVDEIDLEEEK